MMRSLHVILLKTMFGARGSYSLLLNYSNMHFLSRTLLFVNADLLKHKESNEMDASYKIVFITGLYCSVFIHSHPPGL